MVHSLCLRCYTFAVPTSKQRITITATGDLEHILAVERQLHPELSPSELVSMLVRRGHATSKMPRRELVEALAGGVRYPSGARDELRDEWPS
ncbi:MAG TPA: hypothetical protein DCR14_08675 [Acidimicrobiaceae bacterium]|nr:hypothetical protein [Acidimicrobiaceae bacterium]